MPTKVKLRVNPYSTCGAICIFLFKACKKLPGDKSRRKLVFETTSFYQT